MATIEKRLSNLETDMWTGRGTENPPMTVRVAALEKCVKDIVETNKTTRAYTLGTLLTVLASLVVAFIAFRMGWVH